MKTAAKPPIIMKPMIPKLKSPPNPHWMLRPSAMSA
jgi:hypothetical protein